MSNAELVKQLLQKTGARINYCVEAVEACGGDLQKAEHWLKVKNVERGQPREHTAKEGRLAMHVENTSGGNRAAIVELSTNTDFAAKSEELRVLADNLAKHAASNGLGTVQLLEQSKGPDGRLVRDSIQELAGKMGEQVALRAVAFVFGSFGAYIHNNNKLAAIVEIDGLDDQEKVREVGKDMAMHVVFAQPKYLSRNDVPEEDSQKERDMIAERLKLDDKMAKKPPEIIEKIAAGQMGKYYGRICLLDQPYYKDGKRKVSDVLKDAGAAIRVFHLFAICG